MDCLFSKILSKPDFNISVKTGDVKGAGTNSNVSIVLLDEDGRRSRDIPLNCKWRDDFEKGNEDSFKVRDITDFGKLHAIEIWRDSFGLMDDWFIEYIKIKQYKINAKDRRIFEEFPFPIQRWIEAKRRYVFNVYDSVLPQFDEHLEQRRKELEEKKERYAFAVFNPDVPRRVSLSFETIFARTLTVVFV